LIANSLTDLTSKRVSERIPFGETERKAFNALKELLCRATMEPLEIIDMSKTFNIFVDASEYCVGGCLSQISEEGHQKPVAFASCKLTQTQQIWAIIEKEAYACLWAQHKFTHWIFGSQVVIYSDHEPLSFLTETAPKQSCSVRSKRFLSWRKKSRFLTIFIP